MSTISKVREALGGLAGSVGRLKDGNLIARRGFFYTHGYTSEKFASRIVEKLENAGFTVRVVDNYENWTRFRGGASLANSSHWGVIFKVEEPSAEEKQRQSLGTDNFSL